MAIDPTEAQEYYQGSGTFTSVRKLLKPGEKVTTQLLGLEKNFKTKFPLKGKDYSYRLSFEIDGQAYLMDINSRDLIGQALRALYPNGLDKGIEPCQAIFTRRVERRTTQSELQIERVEETLET